MKRLLIFALVLLSSSTAGAAARRRAAVPPSACTLSVGPSTIATTAAGGSAGVSIVANGTCLYEAKTTAGWIVITRTAQGLALQIAPNTVTTPRTGTIDVGGYIITVTQAAQEVTNLLVNGTFDIDTSGWLNGYSVGSGLARWAPDQSAEIVSGRTQGVAELRSTAPRSGYQLHQCAVVQPNTRYDLGARIMIPSGQDSTVSTTLSTFPYSSSDCSGVYTDSNIVSYAPPRDTWLTVARTLTTSGNTRSMIVTFSVGGGSAPPYTAFFDDVYMREKR